MIYVFSDGSLASDGTIDNSVAGRDKGVWTADNQNVAATYWLIYNPTGKPVTGAEQSGDELAARLHESGRLAEHDQQPGRQQRAEPGADRRAQLHGAAQHAAAAWPASGRYWRLAYSPADRPGPNTVNTLGTGAATLDPLIMYQPLAGLQNGKVPG